MDAEQSSRESGMLSRRRFLGVAAGAAATAGSAWPALRSASAASSSRPPYQLVPPARLSIQHFSIRDSISRLDKSVKGYLGGPTFPEDPNDLGPLVDLPGGFDAVFEYLASVGIRGFEFFSYSQGANPPVTVQQIRTKLDSAGLKAVGTHAFGIAVNPVNVDESAYAVQVENAHILGMKYIGHAMHPGGFPGGPVNTFAPWQAFAEAAEALAHRLSDEAGLFYYSHLEATGAVAFFDDPAHPEFSRVRKIDWMAENTKKLRLQVDMTLHGDRVRYPDPVTGAMWDIRGWMTEHRPRIWSWHLKDGLRNSPTPTITTPYVQTIQRTPTFLDALTSGEGHIGKGYPFDPDPAVLGYRRIFLEQDKPRRDYYMIESNSSVGPATGPLADPGRSLRHAKISARNLLAIKSR
jgi:hypothetical protein